MASTGEGDSKRKCSKCAQPVSKTAKFCTSCGDKKIPTFCEDCGKNYLEGDCGCKNSVNVNNDTKTKTLHDFYRMKAA